MLVQHAWAETAKGATMQCGIDWCWAAEHCTIAAIPASGNSAALTQRRTDLTGVFILIGLSFNSSLTVDNDSHRSLFGFLFHCRSRYFMVKGIAVNKAERAWAVSSGIGSEIIQFELMRCRHYFACNMVNIVVVIPCQMFEEQWRQVKNTGRI